MHSQYKNLIEKIKEKLDNISFRWVDLEDGNGKYVYYEDVISSLPQVMEVIKGEIEEKLKDIDSATNPMWIRKQIIDLITLE